MGKTYKRNSSHKPRSHGRSFEKKQKGEWKKQKRFTDPPIIDPIDEIDES